MDLGLLFSNKHSHIMICIASILALMLTFVHDIEIKINKGVVTMAGITILAVVAISRDNPGVSLLVFALVVLVLAKSK